MRYNPGDKTDDALFEWEVPPSAVLADRFGVPPASVWDKRNGEWQARKRRWLSLGIQSEVGRDADLTFYSSSKFLQSEMDKYGGTTSTFDPVVCELSYRWFSDPGDRVLDPFAGGSVRGIVAGVLGREYHGIDLRPEQIAANRAQADAIMVEGDGIHPRWYEGDARYPRDALAGLDGGKPQFDFILSCPPYADLEVYSDNPNDLSTMDYDQFTQAHLESVSEAWALLRDDRFAVWVISDARDKRQPGKPYYGLVADTINVFRAVGFDLYNDIVLIDPIGTARLRSAHFLNRTRKTVRMHQHVLVFVKGSGAEAARRLAPIDPVLLAGTTDDLPDEEEEP